MRQLFAKAEIHLSQDLPFVVFRKPNAAELQGLFQKDGDTYFAENFEESGYVFAPFYTGKTLLIPFEKSEWRHAAWQNGIKRENTVSLTADEQAHQQHVRLVQKGITAIKEGHFQKVVLSRKQDAANDNPVFTPVFENILNAYPEAYVYCFFHPVSGLWMGAFTERLLRVEGNAIHTMALAGTRSAASKEQDWGAKEIQEQQFVTDAIIDALKSCCSGIEVGMPETIQAGKLEHIQSIVNAQLLPGSLKKELIEALHPTPAVCGWPKDPARDFIIREEGYDRAYYSGFHGLLNVDRVTDLFVNLRCMKWENGKAALYIGGGITEGSEPESEWTETVKKAGTMNSILI